MNWNGRVKRIEEQVPTEPDEDAYTIQDFARDIIAAIDARHIVDWCDKEQNADFDYTSLLSPTVADGLDKDEHSRVYALLHHAQKDVALVAEQTGWRSGGREDWHGYRANSAQELRHVMEIILHAT